MAFVTQLSAYALQGDFMDSVDLRIVLPSYSLRFLLLLHFVFLIHLFLPKKRMARHVICEKRKKKKKKGG